MRTVKKRRLRMPGILKKVGFYITMFWMTVIFGGGYLVWYMTLHDEQTVTADELEDQLLVSTWTNEGKNFGIKIVDCEPFEINNAGVGIYTCELVFQGRSNKDVETYKFDFDLQERWLSVPL